MLQPLAKPPRHSSPFRICWWKVTSRWLSMSRPFVERGDGVLLATEQQQTIRAHHGAALCKLRTFIAGIKIPDGGWRSVCPSRWQTSGKIALPRRGPAGAGVSAFGAGCCAAARTSCGVTPVNAGRHHAVLLAISKSMSARNAKTRAFLSPVNISG